MTLVICVSSSARSNFLVIKPSGTNHSICSSRIIRTWPYWDFQGSIRSELFLVPNPEWMHLKSSSATMVSISLTSTEQQMAMSFKVRKFFTFNFARQRSMDSSVVIRCYYYSGCVSLLLKLVWYYFCDALAQDKLPSCLVSQLTSNYLA